MGVQKLESGGYLYPRRPEAEQFIYVALVSVKCQPAHQIVTPSLISFGHTEGVTK